MLRAQVRAFGGGGVGGKEGESGSASDGICESTAMIWRSVIGPVDSGVAAGSVDTATIAALAMLGHQQGALVPAPCPIDDGIVS
ncbi:MAG TPA: hypothetical protein VKB63_00630 [Gemmatimonadales bacterium]|nr:hypothetical protein [Gemmatimonadales bacterium]